MYAVVSCETGVPSPGSRWRKSVIFVYPLGMLPLAKSSSLGGVATRVIWSVGGSAPDEGAAPAANTIPVSTPAAMSTVRFDEAVIWRREGRGLTTGPWLERRGAP